METFGEKIESERKKCKLNFPSREGGVGGSMLLEGKFNLLHFQSVPEM